MRIYKTQIKKYKIVDVGVGYNIMSKPIGWINWFREWEIECITFSDYTGACKILQDYLDEDRKIK